MKHSDSQIEKLLSDIYDGSVSVDALPSDLYYAIADYLKEGLYKGFGGELSDFDKGTKDYKLLNELRTNIYQFSAAKTYAQIVDISSLIIDDENNIRTFSDFNKLGKERFKLWNVDYARSEYNTSIANAQIAVKWERIQDDKDVLELLEFSTNNSPCKECAPFDGLVLPVDNPIWKWAVPTLHFNCMCILLQHTTKDKKVSDKDKIKDIISRQKDVPEMFRMNAGIDRVIFSDKHPFFELAPKTKDNFGLPIPKND